MYILGISAFYHDSAACLIKNGVVVAAAQEERFSRKKHDANFPALATKYCLEEAGIDGADLANIVFYEKPFIKFERLLETYLAFAPKGFESFRKAMPLWIKDKVFQKKLLIDHLNKTVSYNINWSSKLLFSEHHLSHAASAFYPSPFDSAAILTLDAVGEWATTSLATGSGNEINIIKEINFPHSLGLLYSAFTYYTGFKVNSGEYKVMGLAPYGKPIYLDLIMQHLVDVREDGSFQLDMSYFDFATGLRMTSKKFNELFGGPPRKPETPLTQREMDLAASIQKATENILIKLATAVSQETGESNLCLAGGVALNCVANGILLRKKIFEKIWVQPAAGDAGGALGAALAIWHMHHKNKREISVKGDRMQGSYLGPRFDDTAVEDALKKQGAVFNKLNQNQLIERTALALADGAAVGWMQGRMEFGPRALGGRSILADPRSPIMQKQLNLKVKYRESFRPFAPSILEEHVSEWFEHDGESPYMLLVADVKKIHRIQPETEEQELFGIEKLNLPRSTIPAVTHVDYSARIQTVSKQTTPVYYELISRFFAITGYPMLINTSFNVRGEPIVCTPQDAYRCFMGTDLDVLAVGNFFLTKPDQNQALQQIYTDRYELD